MYSKESGFIIKYKKMANKSQILTSQLFIVSARKPNGKKYIKICCIAFAVMVLYQPLEKVLLLIVVIALETILPFQ